MKGGPVHTALAGIGQRDLDDFGLEHHFALDVDLHCPQVGLDLAQLGRHRAHHDQARLRRDDQLPAIRMGCIGREQQLQRGLELDPQLTASLGRDLTRQLARLGSSPAARRRRRRRAGRRSGGAAASTLRDRAGRHSQVAAARATGHRIVDLEHAGLKDRLLNEDPAALHPVLETVQVAQRLQRLDQRHVLQADGHRRFQLGIDRDRVARVARQGLEHLGHRQPDHVQVEARFRGLAGQLGDRQVSRWQQLARHLWRNRFRRRLRWLGQALADFRQQFGGGTRGRRLRCCAGRQQQSQRHGHCGEQPWHQPGPAWLRLLARVLTAQLNQSSVQRGMRIAFHFSLTCGTSSNI